jgi:pyrimidine-nucleoside phosphorylase
MRPSEIISQKKRGKEHTSEELRQFLDSFLKGDVTDYQMSAWLMAVCFRGMTAQERTEWTRLMWKSGESFKRLERETYWVDKHSTGGVGDKTSLILVPVVSSAAKKLYGTGKVKLPMVSGRGLGHTGGTLDKLESVPGFSPVKKVDEALQLLDQNGFFMIGQTEEIAPADRRIYALRDATATVDSIPLIVSSILCKKLAESLDGIVFDVKMGSGAFMKSSQAAKELAEALVSTSKVQKVDAVAVISRMDEPNGKAIGNFVEVEECCEFLEGKQEEGLKRLVTELGARMLCLAGRRIFSLEKCRQLIEEESASPQARELFQKMFENQGGKWSEFVRARESLPADYVQFSLLSENSGFLSRCDALILGEWVQKRGGGRRKVSDNVDHRVGVVLRKKQGDPVKKGESLAEVIVKKEDMNSNIKDELLSAFEVSAVSPAKESLIVEVVE